MFLVFFLPSCSIWLKALDVDADVVYIVDHTLVNHFILLPEPSHRNQPTSRGQQTHMGFERRMTAPPPFICWLQSLTSLLLKTLSSLISESVTMWERWDKNLLQLHSQKKTPGSSDDLSFLFSLPPFCRRQGNTVIICGPADCNRELN